MTKDVKEHLQMARMEWKKKTSLNKVRQATENKGKVLESIIKAHQETCSFTAYTIGPVMIPASDVGPDNCPINGGTEEFVKQTRAVCVFVKSIPGFRHLDKDDQVALLSTSVFEILLLRLLPMFESASDGVMDLLSSMTGQKNELLAKVVTLSRQFNSLGLSEEDIALVSVLVAINPDREGVNYKEVIAEFREGINEILNQFCDDKYPNKPGLTTDICILIKKLNEIYLMHNQFLKRSLATQLGGQ